MTRWRAAETRMLVAVFHLLILLSGGGIVFGSSGTRIRKPRVAGTSARQSNIRGLKPQGRPQQQIDSTDSANTVLQQPERLLLDDSDRAFSTYAFEVTVVEDNSPTATPKLREDATLTVQTEERNVTPSAAPTTKTVVIVETAVEGFYPPENDESEGQEGFVPVQSEENTEKDDKKKDDTDDTEDQQATTGTGQQESAENSEIGQQDSAENSEIGQQESAENSEIGQQESAENSYWEIPVSGAEDQAQQGEVQESEQVEESAAPGSDALGEDNFAPVLDTAEYYFVDLQPFSVFVEADHDLTSDLGIPLYLLLEMNKTLETMVNVHITNMTTRMGIADVEESPVNRRSLADGEPHVHYHWNELFFHGLAELDNSVVHTPESVRRVQAGVLAYPGKLQDFWDNESGKVYESLEVVNITRLETPIQVEGQEEEGKLEDLEPPEEQQTQELQNEAEYYSKRESNVWVMVPLVILFLALCLCLILFAGRLRYLGSLAQERYNEKYGLAYNVYDKDISKDIFKEEYLMSEPGGDDYAYNSGGAGYSDSLGSIDFLSRPISSMKASRNSSSQANSFPVADDETPTEEEDMNGSSDDSREVFSHEDHEKKCLSASQSKSVGFASKVPSEDGSFPSISTNQNENALPTISPNISPIAKGEIFHDESVGSSEDSHIDNGDSLPELRDLGSLSVKENNSRGVRGVESIVAGTLPIDDGKIVMDNSSARSLKNHSSRSLQSNNSLGSNKDGGSVMGNMSGRSTRSQRSVRSSRSSGSFPSDDSFFSCQSDLV